MATDYDRRHAFAAFVWALGVRGESSLTPNYTRFDTDFTSAWKLWCRGDESAWWEGRPSFDAFSHGRLPQEILRGADRWRSHSPLDGRGQIRSLEGWDAEESLLFILRTQPHLGAPENWLALADIYLSKTTKKD